MTKEMFSAASYVINVITSYCLIAGCWGPLNCALNSLNVRRGLITI
ncbi:hypothetical protein VCRA2119O149_1370008 [Vibrio crassostreae]|nr:hypothetical protein VCRA2119O381_1280013 [Vibrio crassostreae]CAK2622573.1 hypothetical protein VCRA2119O149_1370008 [Vibrio crassostreae]